MEAYHYEFLRRGNGRGRAVSVEGKSPERGVQVDGGSNGDQKNGGEKEGGILRRRRVAMQSVGQPPGDRAWYHDREEQGFEEGAPVPHIG